MAKKTTDTGPKGSASKNSDSGNVNAVSIAPPESAHQVEIDRLKTAFQTEMRAKVRAQLKVFVASIEKLDRARRRSISAREGAYGRSGKLPSAVALRKEYDVLFATGTAKHEIVGKLAVRHRVTPRAIRYQLKKTEVN